MPDNGVDVSTWFNGQPGDRLSVFDRGLAYGDGVFETIRITPQGPVLLDFHLQRMRKGLDRLGIDCHWDSLEAEIRAYPGLRQPAVVKVVCTRGVGGRGYATSQVQGPTRVISTHPLPQYPQHYAARGVSIFSCRQRLSINPALAGIKHLNRLEQVLARQEWDSDDYQEGLMLDSLGRVVEGVFSNLFLVRGGRVITPNLEQAGVEGVMRRWLLDQFASQGISTHVGQITLQDIQLADEWFFCNSVYGVWPVRQWENRTWAVGDMAGRAQQWVMDHWQF
ncbi:MAG: aminodeoxychorismate lyase [Alcanivorax sp.]|nr:MAG: aminodeoxychorismate lyase [Alcanivorax sp.]